MQEAIDYNTVMTFGYVIRKLEFDFCGTESNEGKFTLTVTQDRAPDTIGTEIKFEAEFETRRRLQLLDDTVEMEVELTSWHVLHDASTNQRGSRERFVS